MLIKLQSNHRRTLLAVSLASLLSACGGGSSGGSNDKEIVAGPPPSASYSINAFGIKGPLQFAEVNLYRYSSANTYGLGERLAGGQTDAQARLEGLELSDPLSGFYVLEFSVGANTTDLTTGRPPVLSKLRTLVSTDQLTNGDTLYATPLSTMVLSLAHDRWQSGDDIGELVATAQQQVKSIFAPGADSEIDLLTTPPLLTASRDSKDRQVQSWQLRVANEAAAALAEKLSDGATKSVTPDEVIELMALDISDGTLNANTFDQTLPYRDALLAWQAKPLLSLPLPDSDGKTLADIGEILRQETASTGYDSVDTTAFAVAEADLPRPYIATVLDVDYDGILNSEDEDDDADGIVDHSDPFPLDGSKSIDSDGDGVADDDDAFPFDANETRDFDKDGIGDNSDEDDDNDGIADTEDNLTTFGLRDSYGINQPLGFRVRARDNQQQVLLHIDGWRLSYKIYDLAEPAQPVPRYANRHAYFDNSKQEWVLVLPAPENAGDYRLDLQFYCNDTQQDNCTSDSGSRQWQESLTFQVTGNNDNETPPDNPTDTGETTEPDNPTDTGEPTNPGNPDEQQVAGAPININNSNGLSLLGSAIVLNDGTLLSAHNEFFSEIDVQVWRSTDQGQHWQQLGASGTGSLDSQLLAMADNSLVIVQECGEELCLFRSPDGRQWTRDLQFPDLYQAHCQPGNCDSAEFNLNSLIRTRDNKVWLSYSHHPKNGQGSQVYLTSSDDLHEWSAPQAFGETESNQFSPSLLQLDDGSLMLAYADLGSQQILVHQSEDGKTWTQRHALPAFVQLNMGLVMMLDNGKPRLLYTGLGKVTTRLLDGEEVVIDVPDISVVSDNISAVPAANGGIDLMLSGLVDYVRNIYRINIDTP